MDFSDETYRPPFEDEETSLQLSQVPKLGDAVSDLDRKGYIKDELPENLRGTPLYEAIKADDYLKRPEDINVNESEAAQIASRVRDVLDRHNIDLSEAVHDPKFVHSLPHLGFSQLERVYVLGIVATRLDRQLTSMGSVPHHSQESIDDRVFRLSINGLRDLVHRPKSGELLTPERLKVSRYAQQKLLELLDLNTQDSGQQNNNYQESRESKRPPITIDEVLSLSGEEQKRAFFEWVGGLPEAGEDHLPVSTPKGPKRLSSERINEVEFVLDEDRLRFIKEVTDACEDNGSVVSTELFRSSLDSDSSPIPYLALLIKLRTHTGKIIETVILERPERLNLANTQNGEITHKSDDATYLFASDIPDIWQSVFYANAKKNAARSQFALRRYHGEKHAANVFKTLDEMIDGILNKNSKSKYSDFPYRNPY